MKKEVAELRAGLSKTSMRENYTEFVKQERKIVALETEIQQCSQQDVLKTFLVKYGISYGYKILLSLVLLVIVFMYRKHAVIVFSEKYDFAPFGGFISFPTGVQNSISVPFWIFVNNFSFRHIASYVK